MTAKVRHTEGGPGTASEQIVKAAPGGEGMKFQVDARGRRLGIVRPSLLDTYRLMKIMGQHSTNQPLMGVAALAFAVREIDGAPVTAPNSERELQALIGQLGNEGAEAVALCMMEQFGVKPAPAEDEQTG